jgi:hypothetical protein
MFFTIGHVGNIGSFIQKLPFFFKKKLNFHSHRIKIMAVESVAHLVITGYWGQIGVLKNICLCSNLSRLPSKKMKRCHEDL